MALSNIFREPRREITESVVGLVVVGCVFGGWLCADYQFARWLEDVSGGHKAMPWEAGMVIGMPVTAIIVLLLGFSHAVGEAVCDAFQRRGIHLRPRQRY